MQIIRVTIKGEANFFRKKIQIMWRIIDIKRDNYNKKMTEIEIFYIFDSGRFA